MVETFVSEIASAVAGGTVGALVERGSDAARRLLDALRAAGGRSLPAAGGAATPGDQAFDGWSRDDVVRYVEAGMARDDGWARTLRVAWEQLRPEVVVEGGTTNLVSGDVGGHVVQARDVQGGISLG